MSLTLREAIAKPMSFRRKPESRGDLSMGGQGVR